MLNWLGTIVRSLLQRPILVAAVLAADIAGFVGGILYWYGRQMPGTPAWSWPFIPDCPLFGLAGGMALLLVLAPQWTPRSRQRVRTALFTAGSGAIALLAIGNLPGGQASLLGSLPWLTRHNGMWALAALLCLLTVFTWEQPSNSLLTIAAMGQIKYGIWTVTAWVVFWWKTQGLFTFESVFMTITHLAMIVQGLTLFLYFRPRRRSALIAGAWFLLSDFVDYGLGYYPSLPRQIPLPIMQWHTIAASIALTAIFWRLGSRHAQVQVPESAVSAAPTPGQDLAISSPEEGRP